MQCVQYLPMQCLALLFGQWDGPPGSRMSGGAARFGHTLTHAPCVGSHPRHSCICPTSALARSPSPAKPRVVPDACLSMHACMLRPRWRRAGNEWVDLDGWRRDGCVYAPCMVDAANVLCVGGTNQSDNPMYVFARNVDAGTNIGKSTVDMAAPGWMMWTTDVGACADVDVASCRMPVRVRCASACTLLPMCTRANAHACMCACVHTSVAWASSPEDGELGHVM